MIVVGETKIDMGDKFTPIVDYNLKYTSNKSPNHRLVEQFSVAELTGKYINILWEDGSHKYKVKASIRKCLTPSSVRSVSAATAMQPSIERWLR